MLIVVVIRGELEMPVNASGGRGFGYLTFHTLSQ